MGRSSKPQKVKKGNLRAAAAHYANAAKKNKPGKRRSKKGTTGLSSSARSAAVAAAGEVALLRGVFFGLGDEKWREHVDRVDQPHGRLVYDECLHGGNGGCNEPGYMANCESAWKFVADNLGRTTTSKAYLRVHELACRHFGANGDTHMPAERAGMFRDLGDEQIWIHAFGQRAASAAAIEFARDFEVNGRKIVEILPKETGPKLKAQGYENTSFGIAVMPAADVRAGLDWILRAWYDDIAALPPLVSSQGEADKAPLQLGPQDRAQRIRICSQLLQRLDYLHPVPDGCGRVNIVIVNKHLTECGLHPMLMQDPNAAVGLDETELVEQVTRGLDRWAEQRAQL